MAYLPKSSSKIIRAAFMEIIIYAVIAALILGLVIRRLRMCPDGIEFIPNLCVPDEPNPPYDSSKDAFTCLMHSDGSNTICFRGGGGFTANAWKSKEK